MQRGVSISVATGLMFISLSCEIAVAAETTENKERGFYFGAGAGRVEQDAQGEEQILVGIGLPIGFVTTLSPNQVDVDDTDLGWHVTLGYQVNKYLAAEVSYYDFGEASVTERYSANLVLAPLNITVRSNIEAYGPGVSLLGTFPLTSSVELLARGGVLFLDQEVERQLSSFSSSRRTGEEIWMVGVGVQWSFAPRWATRLEYQLTDYIGRGDTLTAPRAGTENIEQLSLSVLFGF